MIGIVIVAHGGLAKEYLLAMEHVVGKHPGTRSIAISAECDRAAKLAEIEDAVREVDEGQGVIVVTDMFGGTPSNLAMKACENGQRAVIYGANLPMLVKLAKARNRNLRDAIDSALSAGRKYINCTENFRADQVLKGA